MPLRHSFSPEVYGFFFFLSSFFLILKDFGDAAFFIPFYVLAPVSTGPQLPIPIPILTHPPES